MPLITSPLLLCFHQNGVPIGITHQECFMWAQQSIRFGDHAGGYKLDVRGCKLFCGGQCVRSNNNRLPMSQIVGVFICGEWAPVARREILQEFDPWSRSSS